MGEEGWVTETLHSGKTVNWWLVAKYAVTWGVCSFNACITFMAALWNLQKRKDKMCTSSQWVLNEKMAGNYTDYTKHFSSFPTSHTSYNRCIKQKQNKKLLIYKTPMICWRNLKESKKHKSWDNKFGSLCQKASYTVQAKSKHNSEEWED
jgi:hypothetical protein